MKFAHMADCHIGSWRDPKLKDLSTNAFLKAIDMSIEKQVNFILISGDLFNTSLPSIDKLKQVVLKLKLLCDKNIPVYIIPGSHDFSPSGKTMLDVLENAGLCINVVKGKVTDDKKLQLQFTIDNKTQTKITGILGRKGMLERKYYEDLDRESLQNHDGFKIFMFHTSLTELKPKELEKMSSHPISLLPTGFDYYAGGHVHIVGDFNVGMYKHVVYPGPLFPNSFSELEKLKHGGFYIYDDGDVDFIPLNIFNVESFVFDCNHKDPKQVEYDVFEEIKSKEFLNTIIALRFKGVLKSGKISDIDFKTIIDRFYEKGSYFVMKNTSKLSTKEFDEIKIDTKDTEDLEDSLINEHLGQIDCEDVSEEEFVKNLMQVLSSEKMDGERIADYESKIKNEIGLVLGVELS